MSVAVAPPPGRRNEQDNRTLDQLREARQLAGASLPASLAQSVRETYSTQGFAFAVKIVREARGWRLSTAMTFTFDLCLGLPCGGFDGPVLIRTNPRFSGWTGALVHNPDEIWLRGEGGTSELVRHRDGPLPPAVMLFLENLALGVPHAA